MKWWLVLILAWAGCGDNDHPARLLMDMSETAPAYGRAPFPSDAVKDSLFIGRIAGLDKMAKQHGDLIGAHLAQLDGFGLRPTIEFFIEGSLDPDTIPEGATTTLGDAFVVVDVDPYTGEDGAPIPFDWRYDHDRHVIAGSPAMGHQLRPGTRYAAVITKNVHSSDGSPIYGEDELFELEHDPPLRWQTTAEAYAHLKSFSQLNGRIAGLTVFTTQNATDALVKARNQIANTAAVAAPTLTFPDAALIFDTQAKLDALLGRATRATSGARIGLERWGNDNPTGVAHDHIAVVASGKTTVARFISNATHTDGPEDETFSLGAGGVPVVQSVDAIPITFVLPKGPMPASGFPVVIFGHGLGGSRHDVLDNAEALAAKGYAVVAIDMWGHGSRLSPTDNGNNLGSKMAFSGDRTLHDGFSDDADGQAYIAFFHGFMNLSAIRDSIRQSALDFCRVAMLIKAGPSLAALKAPYGSTVPKLDPTRVAYMGQSFGTIVGTDLASLEPSIGLYILDVPGGGLVDTILPTSANIGALAIPLAEQLYRTQGTIDRFHPLVGAMQTIFDGADSLTFARHVLKDRFVIENNPLDSRHVVLIEAMNDEIMPNRATEALARGLGVEVLAPNIIVPDGMQYVESPASANVSGQTAVLVQYEPATHGYNWSAEKGKMEYVPGYPFADGEPYPKLAQAITVTEPIYETLEQVTEVLDSYFTTGVPRVRSTLAPVADFDGDGKLDASDPAPYDPTH